MKYPLPYAFARENLLLLEQDGADQCLHWAGPQDASTEEEEALAMARLSALSEVMRQFAPRQLVSHPAATPPPQAHREVPPPLRFRP